MRNRSLVDFQTSLIALIAVGLVSCSEEPSATPSTPTKPSAMPETLSPGSVDVVATFSDHAAETPLFESLDAASTGVAFTNRIDNDHPLNRLYISGFASSGIAIGDVDGDDLPDLYLTRGPEANKLYRQTGPFQFEDITEQAGVAMSDAWSAGASLADVNGDGHLDLYVCVYDGPNRLFLNDGNGQFTDNGEGAGVAVRDASLMAHFQDYDQDGDLDFYLLTNRLYRAGGLPQGETTRMENGKLVLLPEYDPYYRLEKQQGGNYVVTTKGRPDRLFRNDGSGVFEDVSEAAGITGEHYGLSAAWLDYDHDGDLDLYVANDFQDPDRLYQNQGDGTFKDVIRMVVPHTPWFSMGTDAMDMNNDGLVDLVALDMSSTTHYKQKLNMGDMSRHTYFMDHAEPRQLMRNAYFLNSGTGRFLESAHLSGLASSDWSWAVKLADFDNDRLPDVFITNGMTAELTNADLGMDQGNFAGREEWSFLKDQPRSKATNMAFHNDDGYHFHQVAKEWGLDHEGMSYSAAWADFDLDGNLDLVVGHLDEPIALYRNRGSGQARLVISLRGTESNRHGLGTTVTVRQGSLTQTRTLSPASGYLSSNEPVLHFGLGDQPMIDEITVAWPSGIVQVLTGVEGNRHLRIAESTTSVKVHQPEVKPLFEPLRNAKVAKHTETLYDDFAKQPLLPNKLSQLGPGIAVGDLQGNGRDDFVVGAARGEVPHAHFSVGDDVVWGNLRVAELEKMCEDMTPLLIDVDNDEDLDWFVVSGGVEHAEESSPLLRDRLYVQRKKGHFEKDLDALPDLRFSGGAAAAADVDRDGDLDIVIGGRVRANQYPLSPGSVLLRNDTVTMDQPKFVDATDAMAPDLRTLGMVTSVLWSDVNGDGWIDLLVTTEWGPIHTFLNRDGVLEEATTRSGLANYLGWWNGIAGRDLDGDGDIDYVATNFGHNTKYHPTSDHPSRIYYGTFEEGQAPQIIEAKVKEGGLLPVRGKSCSQNAMPFIRNKFPTYHDFASASLTEIYTPTALENAKVFEANTLDTALLINDGTGSFTLKALPPLAQIAPGFGVILTEVNGDGHADLFIAQNFYTPQRETGKMVGGLSVLMLGDGRGGFRPLWPNESGIAVAADAKGAATIDFNGDSRVDFAISANNGPPRLYQNLIQDEEHPGMAIVIRGRGGNSRGIGGRITVHSQSGHTQTAEVAAGGGYLSQSSNRIFFGNPKADPITKVTVRWPDGSTSETPFTSEGTVLIEQPDA